MSVAVARCRCCQMVLGAVNGRAAAPSLTALDWSRVSARPPGVAFLAGGARQGVGLAVDRCDLCHRALLDEAKVAWALRQVRRGRDPATRVPAGSARRHVAELEAAGLTRSAIAERAGVERGDGQQVGQAVDTPCLQGHRRRHPFRDAVSELARNPVKNVTGFAWQDLAACAGRPSCCSPRTSSASAWPSRSAGAAPCAWRASTRPWPPSRTATIASACGAGSRRSSERPGTADSQLSTPSS